MLARSSSPTRLRSASPTSTCLPLTWTCMRTFNARGGRWCQGKAPSARLLKPAAAFDGGGDAHGLAILGHRAAGDVDPRPPSGSRRWRRRNGRPRRRPRPRSGRESLWRTASAEWASPPPVAAMEEVKKNFISKPPAASQIFVRGHRLTVDSCMPMASATVLRLSGADTRRRKARKPSCWRNDLAGHLEDGPCGSLIEALEPSPNWLKTRLRRQRFSPLCAPRPLTRA